jgi:molybdopterin molybdotransferase
MAHAAHDHDSGAGLVSVEDARERVLSHIRPLAPIDLPLNEAYGCVMAADILAPKDLPEFASSAMDGFAVRADDIAAAAPDMPVKLPVVGRAAMGERPGTVVGHDEAVRIATGAPIPAGADCVVPIENCVVEGDRLRVLHPVPQGKHIRPAAEDVRAGDVLVPAGRKLGAPELGMLAAAGFAHAPVFPKPRVVVISTGDELVEPGKPLEFGQIHDSNAFMLAGAIREAGATPFVAGIVRDDPDALKGEVLSQLATADAFVSSGGVSVGERDVVKAAFLHQGDVEFYKVAMQPGMPQGFGLIEGKPYFGVPGNPVSVFVSFEVFVRPALLKMMGRRQLLRPEVVARLEEEISGPHGKTQFARVMVRRDEAGGFVARPTGGRGSNLLSTVARANGLAIVPAGTASLPAGAECRVMVFRSLED